MKHYNNESEGHGTHDYAKDQPEDFSPKRSSDALKVDMRDPAINHAVSQMNGRNSTSAPHVELFDSEVSSYRSQLAPDRPTGDQSHKRSVSPDACKPDPRFEALESGSKLFSADGVLKKSATIEYPDGSSNAYKLDKNGKLVAFTIKDKNGEVSFNRDDAGRWIKTDRFHIESIVNGRFEMRNGNELVYKKPNGEEQVHKADGSIARGRKLSDGAEVELDESGKKATAVYRKNRSKVEATYDKDELTKVIETKWDDKNRTTWTKDDKGIWTEQKEKKNIEGEWKTNGKSDNERRNLRLNVNGTYQFEDRLAFKHTVGSDGFERIEPKITANQDGTKTVEIQYPSAKFRTVTLDKDGSVTKFIEQDEDGRRAYSKEESGKWFLKAGERYVPVPGEFKFEKTGDFKWINGDFLETTPLDSSRHIHIGKNR